MTLADLARAVTNFDGLQHVERIKLFAWYLHTHNDMEFFQPSDIARCYAEVHLGGPKNISQQLSQLLRKKPPQILRTRSGYRLEKRPRDEFDRTYGQRPSTVEVTKLLKELPDKLPELTEKTYLIEALNCLSVGAFRAAIVMTWNLAFHHLCVYILTKKLTEFNDRWTVVFPADHKNGNNTISALEDFGDNLKESKILTIAKSAGIISKDVCKILEEKLGRRNSAAHPSGVKIERLQAEDFIDDLVKNVVLKLV